MKPKWRLKKTLAVIGPQPKRLRKLPDPDHLNLIPPALFTGEDPEHLDWIREQPCAVKTYPFPGATPCRGIVEAHHHTGGRGRSQKADDRRTFPLCKRHHTGEFHGPEWSKARSSFKEWGKAKRRAWQDAMVEKYFRGANGHELLFDGLSG